MNVSKVGNRCTGCYSCGQICPVNAISFKENKEGFFYPSVTQNCINCGKCVQRCHIYNEIEGVTPDRGYAAFIKDKIALQHSSSGGIFAALAHAVLIDGGAVYGCTESSPGIVEHQVIEDVQMIMAMQGSKYVESNLDDVYTSVENVLKKGRCVLFSGTPCQIAGLKSYLQKDYGCLFTVDIVCHGVPSRKLYQNYLKWEGNRNKGEIVNYVFRSKNKHGWSLTYKLCFTRGQKTYTREHMATLSPYYYHFLQGYNYRESCYQCKYAQTKRFSDITICDFWGIEKVAPEMNNYNGVSGVLVNTDKGSNLWKMIQDDIVFVEVPRESIIINNNQLQFPVRRPAIRDSYYAETEGKEFDVLANKYTPMKALIIDGIKDRIPNKYRQKMKYVFRKARRR